MFDFQIRELRLDNGSRVLLYNNPKQPLVSVNLWYKTGSANDPAGKSGLAHLFEHMMFEGSLNVPKGEHFYIVQEAGGICNASTSTDRTNYYEKVPKQYLETMLWLEADRMANFVAALTPETLKNQIDVVTNERLERYDNQPYGMMHEHLLNLLYPASHPYGKPVIGTRDEIGKYSMEDVSGFFRTYYSPANATLIVAGDYDKSKITGLIDKHFGTIPAGTDNPIPVIDPRDSLLPNKKYFEYRDNVELDYISLAWKTAPVSFPQNIAFDLLGQILSGSKSSLLTKRLTIDNRLAQNESAYEISGKYGGYFIVSAMAKPEVTLDTLKTIILEEIDNLKTSDIDNALLNRSRVGYISYFINGLQSISSLADKMNYYDFHFGNPNMFNDEYTAMKTLPAEEIKNLAKTYLNDNYCELRILKRTK